MTGTYTLKTAPGPIPLVGHVPRILGGPLRFLESLPAHADLVRIRVGTRPIYVVCHPELVHTVLVNDRIFDKGGPMYDAVEDDFGNGLVTCPHAVHRRHRRLTQPAFHPTRMPGYAATMTEQISGTIRSWTDGQTIDVVATMSELTARVTTVALFTSDHDHATAQQAHRDITIMSRAILRRVLLPRAWEALPTPAHRRYVRAAARFGSTTDRIIQRYRRDGVDHGDLLSMLLAARDDGHSLSDTEIHDHVKIFLLAGIDTTAALLAWTLHLLARRPDLQSQLRAETHAVLAGRAATLNDLPHLDLTRRILTETLRLYPPAWILTRTVRADTELGGHPLPAGTSVLFSPYLVHHRADLYPNPDRFNPDRWINHDPTTQFRTGYIPFGGGARKCIGETFAMTEATLALAAIATHWHFTPTTPGAIRPRFRSTLIPRPLPLRVTDLLTNQRSALGSPVPEPPRT